MSKTAEYRKQYYEKNKEKLIEQQRARRAANPEKVREYSRVRRKKAETDPVRFIDLTYRAMLDRSRKKNREVNVDREYLLNLLVNSKGKCALSGLPLSLKVHDPYRASPDRKDSRKGYVKGNIHFVASCVNIAKSDMPTKDFVKMCKAVAVNART
jgi:dihydroorotase-like cyclic amidohydrolase